MTMAVKDISGQRFGRLIAVELLGPDKSGSRLWRCVCDCGGEKVTRGYSLRRGHVKSCGCIVRESAWDHPRKHKTPEDAAWLFNWKQCLRNIKHRSLDMYLKFEEFRELSTQPCHYCGAPPETRPSQRGRASIQASGLDRVDNDRGYHSDNVVPCCTWCNRAKNSGTKEEFLNHCKHVAEHTNASIARREA